MDQNRQMSVKALAWIILIYQLVLIVACSFAWFLGKGGAAAYSSLIGGGNILGATNAVQLDRYLQKIGGIECWTGVVGRLLRSRDQAGGNTGIVLDCL